MKLLKTKSLKTALFAVIVIAALLFAAAFGVKPSFAKADSFSGNNFIYSAELQTAGGTSASIAFGKTKDSSYTVTADVEGGTLALTQTTVQKEEPKTVTLKSAECNFGTGNLKLTVLVNEGVVKVFTAGGDVAVIVNKLHGYTGGGVEGSFAGFTPINVNFISTDVPGGHIYIGGYTLDKVVNLTDGNKKLTEKTESSAGEYTVKGGVITISDEYLRTLEAGVEYRFRAVTSFTDFDFTVKADFTAASLTPSIDKYYKGAPVTLELSGGAKVERLFIDGTEYKDFTANNGVVTVSADAISGLSNGKHTVKLYTDKGRPEASINISERIETVVEPEEKVTHVFLWVDLAIFGAAILGYAVFSIVKRVKGK